MTESGMQFFGAVSYGLAAVAFLGLSMLLVAGWRGRKLGGLLLAACVLTAIWAVLLAIQAYSRPLPLWTIFVAEMVRVGVWIFFLRALLMNMARSGAPGIIRWGVPLVWIAGTAAGLWLEATSGPEALADGAGQVWLPAGLILSLIGISLVEQLYRNTPERNRWAVKLLCLGIGSLFAFDLFLYAQAMLLNSLDFSIWSSRGVAFALTVPLLAIAARRNPEWSLDVFVSRQVVLYSATLMGVGIYLLVMALGGYYIRAFGGDWGTVVQVLFFFGAGVVLMTVLFSSQLRARAKVFLSKHFYRNKYEYRDEWLRLIGTLSSAGAEKPIDELSIQALAQVVNSPGGMLWMLDDENHQFVVTAQVECAAGAVPAIDKEDSLPRFLGDRGWVVDVDEYTVSPARYGELLVPAELAMPGRFRLIVPINHHGRLIGFVALCRPDGHFSLTYEDTDLLKTIGQQIGGYLSLDRASTELAESRQFEAYNRLVTFMMHDLKNIIAQQSLVVSNAERHKRNPDFVDDAIATIGNSVERMQRLLEQLQRGGAGGRSQHVILGDLAAEVATRCAGRKPEPLIEPGPPGLSVRADPERLTAAIEHLVRNAQDATPDTGEVALELEQDSGIAIIRIRDNGGGMSEQFVRERLFRPFDSTKGSKGMGIGAYQARDYVRTLGGELKVDTSPGDGALFTITLPRLGAEEDIATGPLVAAK
jgi:putative PEP-CTERM system histidine kinase